MIFHKWIPQSVLNHNHCSLRYQTHTLVIKPMSKITISTLHLLYSKQALQGI